MKKFLIIVLVVLGFVAVGIGALVFQAYRATAPLVATTERFVALLGEGDAAGAHALGTEDFRGSGTPDDLAAYAALHGIGGNLGVTLDSRSYTDDSNGPDYGDVSGAVTRADGSETAIAVHLERAIGGDAWMVDVVTFGSTEPVLPPEDELRALVADSDRRLVAALRARDMTAFHAGNSLLWQRDASVEEMNAAYESLFAHAGLLGEMFRTDPEIAGAPAMEKRGLVYGFAASATYRRGDEVVTTSHFYIREGFSWRLAALHLTSGEE